MWIKLYEIDPEAYCIVIAKLRPRKTYFELQKALNRIKTLEKLNITNQEFRALALNHLSHDMDDYITFKTIRILPLSLEETWKHIDGYIFARSVMENFVGRCWI